MKMCSLASIDPLNREARLGVRHSSQLLLTSVPGTPVAVEKYIRIKSSQFTWPGNKIRHSLINVHVISLSSHSLSQQVNGLRSSTFKPVIFIYHLTYAGQFRMMRPKSQGGGGYSGIFIHT